MLSPDMDLGPPPPPPAPTVPVVDVLVADHGSILILHALTAAAKDWVDHNLPEDAQRWGSDGVVVEPRYVDTILDGMQADGLSIV